MAYFEGNSRWPQNLYGIRICLGNALFQSGRPDWKGYFESALSQDQVGRLGKAMSNMHHQKGIPYSVANKIQAGDELVPEARLHALWDRSRYDVARQCYLVARIRDNLDPSLGEIGGIDRLTDPQILAIFDSMTNVQEDYLREFYTRVYTILCDDDQVGDLLQTYQKTLLVSWDEANQRNLEVIAAIEQKLRSSFRHEFDSNGLILSLLLAHSSN